MGLNLSLNKHVAWGKLLTYSVPQFLHLQGIQNNISVLLFQYLFSRYLLSAKHWGLGGLPADLGETMNSQGHFRSGERIGGKKWRRDQVFVGWGRRHKPRPLGKPLGVATWELRSP